MKKYPLSYTISTPFNSSIVSRIYSLLTLSHNYCRVETNN